MKTKDLCDLALDFSVECAHQFALLGVIDSPLEKKLEMNFILNSVEKGYIAPSSSDWCYGGPIIQKEKIATFEDGGKWFALHSDEMSDYSRDHDSKKNTMQAHSLLVAAMRAYVFRILGESVEVPKTMIGAE
jgi:hypothetical protein